MATITVTGLGDAIAVDGLVTLREAITAANTNAASGDAPAGSAGLDTINFAIPGAGVQTINITSALPGVTDPVTIDGWSQGGVGYTGSPLIELNGAGAPGSPYGLVLNGVNSSTIRGLIINRFGGDGIFIGGNNNVVVGNYIGTNSTGNAAAANLFHGVQVANGSTNNRIGTDGDGVNDAAERNVISGNTQYGIILQDAGTNNNVVAGNYIGTNAAGNAVLGNGIDGILIYNGAQNNTIGGSNLASRNIISGNSQHGVFIFNDTSDGNTVRGNYIGTDITGTVDLGNGFDGIPILYADNTTVQNNLLSGNNRWGILLQYDVTGTVVAGNLIGTNAAGTAALGNTYAGIDIRDGASNNTIGGTTVGARNVISGNTGNFEAAGIEIFGVTSNNNIIRGNFIGTNAAGTAALGNRNDGVRIFDGSNNIIGGSAPGAGNLISGNQRVGVYIGTATATGNTVQGNRIGTDVTGTLPIPNGVGPVPLYGVGVDFDADNNLIGGTNPGEGNTVAFNIAGGVVVGYFQNNSTSNRILGNSIFSNGGLGIDLSNGGNVLNGVTANDVGDPDAGSNRQQNFPLLSSITDGGTLGTLNSLANTSFRIEFFANTTADASGNGEGETFLGFQNVTTDISGNASFNFAFAANPAKPFITTTATNLTTGDTSEFSGSVQAEAAKVSTPMILINTANGLRALGSNANDIYSAPNTNDTIYGYAGEDCLFGQGGNDYIEGGLGNDSLSGGIGNDTVLGGMGNDSLRGDAGADSIVGGTGSDVFVYSAASEGGDTINFFESAFDNLRVSSGGFGGGLVAGVLPASQFLSGSSLATNATQRFVYDSSTGILRFDTDGNGGGASTIVATFVGAPAISNTNIVVF